jgi:tetratricopeptide (TPR) repeat protein
MRSTIVVLALLVPGLGWANPSKTVSKDKMQTLADATLKGQQSQGYFNMGRHRMERAKYDEALDLFNEAYRLAPQPKILFEITRCYVRMGKMSRAIAAHRRYTRSFKAPSSRLIAALRFGELIKERGARVHR